MDENNIIKKPFVNYTLNEDKKENDIEVISLKINKKERELINRLQSLMNIDRDGTVIKVSLGIAEKVILSQFGEVLFKKLTSGERVRHIIE
jgi:hypothetical protein